MPRTFVDGRQVKRWKVDGVNVKKAYFDNRLVFANNPDPILGRVVANAVWRVDHVAWYWFNLRTGHVSYGCWDDRESRTEFVSLNGYNTPGKHIQRWQNGDFMSFLYQDDWCPGAGTLAPSYWYPGVSVPEVVMYSEISAYISANYSRSYVDILEQPTPANDYTVRVQTYDPFPEGTSGTFVLAVNLTGDSTGIAADYSTLYGSPPPDYERTTYYTPSTGNCLRFDTLVKMYDGSVKRLCDLKAGDVVLSNRDGILVPGTVVSLRHAGGQPTYELDTGVEKMYCNDAHPWKTASGWKAINAEKASAANYENIEIITSLEVGNFMVNEMGNIAPLRSLRKTNRIEHLFTVDITDGIDTLYVSGSGKEFYLTHNKREGRE